MYICLLCRCVHACFSVVYMIFVSSVCMCVHVCTCLCMCVHVNSCVVSVCIV